MQVGKSVDILLLEVFVIFLISFGLGHVRFEQIVVSLHALSGIFKVLIEDRQHVAAANSLLDLLGSFGILDPAVTLHLKVENLLLAIGGNQGLLGILTEVDSPLHDVLVVREACAKRGLLALESLMVTLDKS